MERLCRYRVVLIVQFFN